MSKKAPTFEESAKEYLDKFKTEEQIMREIRQLSYFINQLILKQWLIREDLAKDQEEKDDSKTEEGLSENGRLHVVE